MADLAGQRGIPAPLDESVRRIGGHQAGHTLVALADLSSQTDTFDQCNTAQQHSTMYLHEE